MTKQHTWRRALGPFSGRKLNQAQRAEVKRLRVEEGLTIKVIGEKFNISEITVRKYLFDMGVDLGRINRKTKSQEGR